MHDGAGGQKKAGGLATCGGCQGVFPSSKLEKLGTQYRCAECLHRHGPSSRPLTGPVTGTVTGPVTGSITQGAAPATGPVTGPAAPPPLPGGLSDTPARPNFTPVGFSRRSAPEPPQPSSGMEEANRWKMVARGRGAVLEPPSQTAEVHPESLRNPETGESLKPQHQFPSAPRGLSRGLPEYTRSGPSSPDDLPAPPKLSKHGAYTIPPERPGAASILPPPMVPASAAAAASMFGPPVAHAGPATGPIASTEAPTAFAPSPISRPILTTSPAAPSVPRPIPGFPDRGVPAIPGARGPVTGPVTGPAATGTAATVTDGASESETGARRSIPQAGFAEYAEIRQKIDAGDDTLATRRRAAELASRMGLTIEAVEHYKRCTELAPDDDRLRILYDNVRRSAGIDRGGIATEPVAPERKIAEEARPFWTDLGDALGYPLRGQGMPVLLVGGAVLGLGQLLGAINAFGFAVSVMIAGYCSCYLFDVINSTGAGKSSPPEMPEMASFLETYVFPLLSILTCAFVSYAPFMLVTWLAPKVGLPSSVTVVLAILAFAWGTFAMPMTLLVRAMFQSWSEPLNPKLVFGSIGRIFPDYIAAYIAIVLLWVGYGLATGALWLVFFVTFGAPSVDAVLSLDGLRMLSWVLFTICSWPLFLYTWMLQGHLLGRLYRQGMRRLAWFMPPSTRTHDAKRLSVALGAGAALATCLLCAAAWAATRAWTVTGGSANAAALFTKCPLQPGSRLSYCWSDTDGGAGLTTYVFEAAGEGKLRVSAVTRSAANPDCVGPAEELGVFDTTTGSFIQAGSAWGTGIHFDGRKGEHVAFYGPPRSSVGSTYLNTWPVRGSATWQGHWPAWKVQATDPVRPAADHYYDTKTGVLVGRFYGGMGHQSTSYLVAARNVGVQIGPKPDYDFGKKPLDWTGDDAKGEKASGVDGIDEILEEAVGGGDDDE